MALHEDEENTNADIIQDVMEGVEVAEEESILVSVNLNESLEADEEENDMEVEVNSNTTAIKQDELLFRQLCYLNRLLEACGSYSSR